MALETLLFRVPTEIKMELNVLLLVALEKNLKFYYLGLMKNLIGKDGKSL